jgi:predicted alpha-1,2-mannosidase
MIVGCSTGSKDPVKFVEPFIGTGGHGHTYPGATLPFGMVQLSPDTRLTGWDGCSGYHYSDNVIYGFSHTHLSGTGVSDYGDILLMPVVGSATSTTSAFRHEKETASPGYYSVLLDDHNIKVELTVTPRVGIHRYTFPANKEARIFIDLAHRDKVIDSSIAFKGGNEVEGFRRSEAWAKDQHVYFVARFSKLFSSYGMVGEKSNREGHKAFVMFNTKANEQITVKVGISAVSIEGARKNLDTETNDLDFDQIKNAAQIEWNRALSKIKVEGGTVTQKRIFYTALYHALLNPNLYMDVNGLYRGRDLDIHKADNFTNYTVFSLWDTFRALHPLFTIIEPDRTNDFIKTFIAQYKQGGMLPVWELAANETGCMIGYHSVPVIVDAYIKGIRDYDVQTVYKAMKHSAEQDHLGLKHYKKNGYIPSEEEAESVSKTLEYAYDDWCIAQMAKALGNKEDYQHYLQRAQYYKNLFDPGTGFMRAKMKGLWFTPFDPAEVNFNYTEANAWQYSFFLPQDISGLMALMGNQHISENPRKSAAKKINERFIAKLDELFTVDSSTTGRDQADITGLIGQYAHGNEPSHHMAYLYNYAGQPWKTQQRVRQILDTLYTDQPDGLCGNEDCGQMSAWYVMSAMGFYPVTPGQDFYAIGTPLFPKVVINVGKNRTFTVIAEGVSKKNIYIQSAQLNGESWTKSLLRHKDIKNGGILVFKMGPAPNKDWGSRENDLPYSAITEHLIQPTPYVASGSRMFTKSTEVALASVTPARIYYTLDGSTPTTVDRQYTKPFTLTRSTVVKAIAVTDNKPQFFVLTARFDRIRTDLGLELNSTYSSQYSAGGDMALIDGIRGGSDFRTGTWQGYHGVDLDAVVDLGRIKRIRQISIGFLQDSNAWIFMPEKVEYSLSKNGKQFSVDALVPNVIPHRQQGAIIKDFKAAISPTSARFVRIKAKNMGICPSWHKGAGEKAWIFADEIIIN